MSSYTIATLRSLVRDNKLDIPLSGTGVTKAWLYDKLVAAGVNLESPKATNKRSPKATNKRSPKATNKSSSKDVVQSSSSVNASGPVLFYGHTAAKAKKFCGNEGLMYLSNWARSIFTDNEGNTFYSNEQYMMWRKATLFGDDAVAEEIMHFGNIENEKEWNKAMGAIKKLGRKVSNFDQEIWETNRYAIMLEGLTLKFSQDEVCKKALLATGNRLIAEASPRDRIWGIGLGPLNPDAQNSENWKGKNLLGKALVEIRDKL